MTQVNLLLQSIAQAALEATAARQCWLLAAEGDHLRVMAFAGEDAGGRLDNVLPCRDEPAGYVVASGQPLAMRPTDGSAGASTGGVLGRVGSSVLCIPCAFDDRVVGVLQLVDKLDSSAFSFDDLQLATVLSAIAGTALREGAGLGFLAPPPEEVARELGELASADPARYAAVAAMIGALLAQHA